MRISRSGIAHSHLEQMLRIVVVPYLLVTDIHKRMEQPPEKVGPYSLIRRLGHGGTAQVWLAQKDTTGRASKLVALKLTARHALGYGSRRRMFETEARMSALLNHSNIVQVFDVLEHDGRGVLVMEWVEGLNLAELVEACRRTEQRLPLELAAYIIGEILAGLAYAHGSVGRGATDAIVHRDMSPQNVVVSVSGEVKIADFGTARLSSEETSGLHVSGKLRYMPPEQIMGDSRAASVDLFAVGAIFHELLEGERFHAGVDREGLLAQVKAGVIPPLTREIPAELAELRRALLEPDARQRIASAVAALDLLHRWSGFSDSSSALAELVEGFVEASDEADRSLVANLTTVANVRGAGERESLSGELDDEAKPNDARHRRLLLIGALVASGVLGYLISRDKQARVAARDASDDGRVPQAKDLRDADVVGPDAVADRDLTISLRVDPIPPDIPSEAQAAVAEQPLAPVRKRASKPRPRQVDAAGAAVSRGEPAHVKLLAHQYLYLEIKIGEQRARLDPTDTLDLVPGAHAVKIREPPGPWSDAGTINVEAGSIYQVMFERPGRMVVVVTARPTTP